MTDTRYRKLLLIYLVVTAAAIAASAFPTYSEALETALGEEPETWLWRNTWASVGLYSALVMAWVIGLVGLFRFRRWGRSLSLYTTAAGIIIAPLAGASLSSGLESGLYEASAIIWGGILALSYFSPVSDRFGR
jgi:uncharacterized membrane protein